MKRIVIFQLFYYFPMPCGTSINGLSILKHLGEQQLIVDSEGTQFRELQCTDEIHTNQNLFCPNILGR